MKKINFATSLLLAPIVYTIHHFEEHILFNFREWRLQYFQDNNALSTELVFMILTGITLIYILLHKVFENRATAMSVILFLMASQIHNVLFHSFGTLYFWHFSPGLYTALALYLPVNIFICYRALQEGWLNWLSLGVLFVMGGLVFWMFEIFGPIIIGLTVLSTYAWISVESIRNNQTLSQQS